MAITVNINHKDPSQVGKVVKGDDVALEVALYEDNTKINTEGFTFVWNISKGKFKNVSYTQTSDEWVTSDFTEFVIIGTDEVTSDSIEVMVNGRKEDTEDTEITVTDSLTIYLSSEPLDFETKLIEKLGELNTAVDKGVRTFQEGVNTKLQRTSIASSNDLGLWIVIRRCTEAISYTNYSRFMNMVLCGDNSLPYNGNPNAKTVYDELRINRRYLPFNDTDAYRLLKAATEAFLLVNSGVALNNFPKDLASDAERPSNAYNFFTTEEIEDLQKRLENKQIDSTNLGRAWDTYLQDINGDKNSVLPYLEILKNNLGEDNIKNQIFLHEDTILTVENNDKENKCIGVLRRKLIKPFLLELIWSYWHEEGMLVQTMNAIARRFQNMRSPNGGRDPLTNFEIDSLRPLSNILWGYIQDEQHRLSLVRRTYEYDHHYGISLQGKAVPKMYPADSRSKFIEAFHQLLHLCSTFYKQDDDTTVKTDGFPLLNALQEVNLILSQGAHNQFGDLPSTARQEMLIQQWILARPEFREFLPTRLAVPFKEDWMYRVEAMKTLQSWTDVSVTHFRNLAVFGEKLLLGIRYGSWSQIDDSQNASNWARYWRAEIQGYIHAYRAVTGVDLSSVTTAERIDSTPPSVHLYKRLMAQSRRF